MIVVKVRTMFNWTYTILFMIVQSACGTQIFNKLSKISSTCSISPQLLPVLHNVMPDNAKNLAFQLSSIGLHSCTISLRHPTAIQALDIFIQHSNDMVVGASTVVSESQIREVKKCGAKFVSTMFPCYELIKTSHNSDISILCGVVTKSDTESALEWGAQGLKFYPANQVSPEQFKIIKNGVGTKINNISCYVAGGISNDQYETYLQAGIDGFAIGIDCNTINSSTVADLIKQKHDLLYKVLNT